MVLETKKLSKLQIELLKVFSYELPEEQLLEIKLLLANYFAQKATNRIDEIWDQRGWNSDTVSAWGKEHMRKSEHG